MTRSNPEKSNDSKARGIKRGKNSWFDFAKGNFCKKDVLISGKTFAQGALTGS